MTPEIFKYTLTIGYAFFVLWLSWVGMRRTRDLKGFAIGNMFATDKNAWASKATLCEEACCRT